MLAHSTDSDYRLYGSRKRALFASLAPGATVLELGAGAGPNARYYPPGIQWLAVEPNLHFHSHLKQAAAAHGLDLTLVPGIAEKLPLDSESVDAVVSTLVLCSVDGLPEAFAEIERILRPGGVFLFVEHVAAPEGTVLRRLQHFFRHPWGFLADGCRPDRDTGRLLAKTGFNDLQVEPFSAPLGLIRPHIIGSATKAAAPRAS